MNRKLIVGLFLAISGTVTPLWAQAPRVVAIRAGHLFDSKSGQMLTNQMVLINGEKITEVGAVDRVQIPSGAQLIDLSQATVLPGLIDAHTHVYSSLSSGARVNTTKEAWTLMAIGNAQTTLRAGFTTVRDVGTHGEGYGDVDVRNAINRGLFDGPRMQVSTRGIGASGSDYIGGPGSTITGGNQGFTGLTKRAKSSANKFITVLIGSKCSQPGVIPSALTASCSSSRHLRWPNCKRLWTRHIAITVV